MNKSLALFAAAVSITAAGCAYEPTCDYSDAPYMSAQSIPSLRAPEGLDAPDRSASLTIPPAAAGAPPIPTGETRCLDRPPSYYQTGSSSQESKAAPAPPAPAEPRQ